MKCPECGKEMRDGYLFCSKDGAFSFANKVPGIFENAKNAEGFVKITELKPSHRTRLAPMERTYSRPTSTLYNFILTNHMSKNKTHTCTVPRPWTNSIFSRSKRVCRNHIFAPCGCLLHTLLIVRAQFVRQSIGPPLHNNLIPCNRSEFETYKVFLSITALR